MKLTKLSYYLIYLSYVLETYLCIAMGNPTSIQQLILTILWGVSIIIHFTLTVYFEKLYIINTIYLLAVCVWCLLNDPVNHLLQTIATGVVGLLLSILVLFMYGTISVKQTNGKISKNYLSQPMKNNVTRFCHILNRLSNFVTYFVTCDIFI